VGQHAAPQSDLLLYTNIIRAATALRKALKFRNSFQFSVCSFQFLQPKHLSTFKP